MMKKTILLSALLISAGLMQAQTRSEKAAGEKTGNERVARTPDEKVALQVQRAEKDLALTATQKAEWERISLERILANEPLKEKLKGSTTPEERKEIRQQMRSNQERFHNSAQKILTPEQKEKYESIRKDRMDRHGKRKGHRKMEKDKGGRETK